VLRDDKRRVGSAASHAQKAIDDLNGVLPVIG
jgi:antirestriction protein ArdC